MSGAAIGMCCRGSARKSSPRSCCIFPGPNGTGKTTLLRVVSGLLRPEQGSVTWLGQSIDAIRTDYQATLAYASHEPALKADLTALENLRFAVGLKRRVTADELRAALARTGVAACADLPARVLVRRPASAGRHGAGLGDARHALAAG